MTEVRFEGPLFDGSAEWMLTHGIEQARIEFAEDAKLSVKAQTRQFRAPTGRYEGLINIVNESFRSRVRPGVLPYVRWLEGTSRRNQTTRFKGYHVFRKARENIEGRAVPFFEQQLEPVIRRINGR